MPAAPFVDGLAALTPISPNFRTIILKFGLCKFFDNLCGSMYNTIRNTEGVLGHAILENEWGRQ